MSVDVDSGERHVLRGPGCVNTCVKDGGRATIPLETKNGRWIHASNDPEKINAAIKAAFKLGYDSALKEGK